MLLDHDADHQRGMCTHCGVHRSTWDPNFGGDKYRPAVRPVWSFCLMCQQEAALRDAGPPAKNGYHIVWEPVKYD